MYSAETLQAAHSHSAGHETEIARSATCGCFYCLRNFPPGEIKDWVEDQPRTALCPRCGIDSVLGDASSYDVQDRAFLEAMHEHWFERTVTLAEANRKIFFGRIRTFFSALAARLGARRR